jgi:hypothetical protein
MSLQPAPIRVSDADRERATDLLREHWSAGRLDGDELDERCAAALAARTDVELSHALRELPASPPPPRPDTSAATTSLILGLTGLGLFFFSAGFLSVLTLAISGTAWWMGHGARRRGLGLAAKQGKVMGMAGTALSLLWLAGCAVVLL